MLLLYINPILTTVSEIAGIVGAISSAVLAIAGVPSARIYYRKFKNQRIDKAFEGFRYARDELSRNRNEYYRAVLELYSNEYSKYIDGNLIKRSEWLPKKYIDGEYQFYRLNEVVIQWSKTSLEPMDVANSIKNDTITMIGFPIKKKGYSYNINELKIREKQKRMTNGRGYRLDCHSFNRNNVTLFVLPSTYYAYQNTCEVLSYEVANKVIFQEKKSDKRKTRTLSLNSLKQRNKAKDLFDFSNRHVGIGINTLVILKNYTGEIRLGADIKEVENCLVFLLHERSSNNVDEAMGTYHVVPAGTFQAIDNKYENTQTDFCLENTVHREFMEELFDMKEFSENTIPEKLGLNFPEIYYLGFGLDVLTTKCEIMTCMVIDLNDDENRGFHPNRYHCNYEGDGTIKLLTKENLLHYMYNERTLPVTRDILKIVLNEHSLLGIEQLQDESTALK